MTSSQPVFNDRVLPYLLDPLDIKPVLLHGDLWVRDVTL